MQEMVDLLATEGGALRHNGELIARYRFPAGDAASHVNRGRVSALMYGDAVVSRLVGLLPHGAEWWTAEKVARFFCAG